MHDSITEGEGKEERKARFIQLRAKGRSLRSCARTLKISTSTGCSWERELEGEIARLRGVELEALFEQYGLLKKQRVRLLGEQIASIKKELSCRKLSDVQTDKLLEILLKYLGHAGAESRELKLLSDGELKNLRDKIGTKMDTSRIASEMCQVLMRYRSGVLREDEAGRELAFLQAMLKAEEQTEIEKKLDKLTSLIGGK